MKKMKRVVSLLLVMLLIGISVSGCGNENSSNKNTSKTDDGEVQIEYWISYGSSLSSYLDELVNAFNDEYAGKYRINMVFGGGDLELCTKIETTDQEHLPGLVAGTPITTEYYSSMKNIVPIQKLIDEDEEDWTGDMLAGVKEAYSNRKGEMVGFPIGVGCTGYYVNVDILKKAGHSLDELTSYEQIVKVAKDIKAKGAAPYGISFYSNTQEFTDAITLQGLPIYDQDNGNAGAPTKSMLSSSDTKAALKKYMELWISAFKSDAAYTFRTDLEGNVIPAFVQENIAIVGMTSSYVKRIEAYEPDFEWVFITDPALDDSALYKDAAICQGHGAWLVDTGDERVLQGSYEFLKFLSRVENQRTWCTSTGYIPYTESAYNDAEYQNWMQSSCPYSASVKAKLSVATEGLNRPLAALSSAAQEAFALMYDHIEVDLDSNLDEVINLADESLNEAIEIDALRKK